MRSAVTQKLVDEFVERAELLFQRENGTRGSNCIHAGEAICRYLRGQQTYQETLDGFSLKPGWQAIMEDARRAVEVCHKGRCALLTRLHSQIITGRHLNTAFIEQAVREEGWRQIQRARRIARRLGIDSRALPQLLALFCFLSVASASAAPAKGLASWYGDECKGLPMANGKPFVPAAMTCASWHYPLGTKLRVTADTGRAVVVTVTDRGPHKRLRGRIVDLSHAAFAAIADTRAGLVRVTVKSERN